MNARCCIRLKCTVTPLRVFSIIAYHCKRFVILKTLRGLKVMKSSPPALLACQTSLKTGGHQPGMGG